MFDEWAKPSVVLSAEAERILGVNNAKIDQCRSTDVVLEQFSYYITAKKMSTPPIIPAKKSIKIFLHAKCYNSESLSLFVINYAFCLTAINFHSEYKVA